LRARGGYTLSMEWTDRNLISADIRAERDGSVTIRSARVLSVENGGQHQAELTPQGDYVITLSMTAGQTVRVS